MEKTRPILCGEAAEVSLLKALARIPSVSADIAQVNRAVGVLAAWLKEHGVAVSVESMPDGRNMLWASTAPGKVQDFLFCAHLDVVPAPEEMFDPVERDGWLCGRGTGDCKGNVVAIARILAELNGKASVGAVFTTDEETGGATGYAMVERGYAARKLVLVMDSQPYSVCVGEKGHTYFTLAAHGRSGHASRPWECVNAVDALLEGLGKLRRIWPLEATAEDFWHDTLAATVLSAGDVPNRIPDVASATLNLRYVDPSGGDAWEARIREATGLDVSRGEDSPPVVSNPGAPVLLALQRHLRGCWPERPVPFVRMNGATDARAFVSLGVPLAITCVEKRGDHAADEAVRLASIGEVADALSGFFVKGGE